MANFKGGFAFNNAAAKVEVEQAPDGTLIRCVNPVTGKGLNAGNYSEVITGTAASPFGDYTVEELVAGLQAGNMSMFAEIDASALGIQDPIIGPIYASGDANSLIMDGAQFTNAPALVSAYSTRWRVNNTKILYMYNSGTVTDASAYMSTITSTVTIYHHPMP